MSTNSDTLLLLFLNKLTIFVTRLGSDFGSLDEVCVSLKCDYSHSHENYTLPLF